MSIPQTVNICGMEYTVRQDKDEYLSANGLLGEILYSEQEIYIKSAVSEERKVKLLIHEIVHGILFEIGAIKGAGDESIVHFLGICLNHFIKNNDFEWVNR